MIQKNQKVIEKIKGGLIVSCQALQTEPLYSSYIMGRMAVAAELGGAVAIRAKTPCDIIEIKKHVKLPVIGLYKQVFDGCDVYITPTYEAVDELVACGCEIIAMDATNRLRPNGETITEFFKKVREKYPNQLFMADCSENEDAIRAQELGFDLCGTTMCGYTERTKGMQIPNYTMIEQLAKTLTIPLIAEGGIWEVEQLRGVFNHGAYAAVIGTAITRPMDITKRFVSAIK